MENLAIDTIEEFPMLTRNALKAVGIYYAADLALLSTKDLRKIDMIGKKGRDAIIAFCRRYDISLSARDLFKGAALYQQPMANNEEIYIIEPASSQFTHQR